MIYLAFFASGVSGLIYQVVWVRAFGNVFGNTIYSASIVVAVFMLGLGVGSSVASGGGMAAGFAGATLFVAITPVFAVAGIMRGVRNSQVNSRIEERHSKLPVTIVADEEQALDLFFPLSPSPTRIEISYTDAQGASHQLDIDTSKTLAGLHLAPSGGSQASGAP